MQIIVAEDYRILGEQAALSAEKILNCSIREKGTARIVLSTGSSQFALLEALVKRDVDWSKVEMFHLDEYIHLPDTHPASFRRYLKERFVHRVPLHAAHFVNGEGDLEKNIRLLTEEIQKAPIDLAIVGIGENAHIAFNDPPADFETTEAYMTVNLDQKCKEQQVGEGWFSSISEVPSQAITMTPYQIMQSRAILSFVPHQVKAQAVKDTLENDRNPNIPATILKEHPQWTLYLDKPSASLVSIELLGRFR